MELLGQIGERKILYCSVRSDATWFDKITFHNWVAFTIVDNEDKELIEEVVNHCVDKEVFYTCSAGHLSTLTEDYFDDECVWREVQKSEQTGLEQNYEDSPVSTSHSNFSEGFWFAAFSATKFIDKQAIEVKEVVCIDCTIRKVRGYLLNLIEKINNDWLPSDNETEEPFYDN